MDERLSRPGWLTYSGHLSAAGRAQDGESLAVKDQRSTTAPRNQPGKKDCKLMADCGLASLKLIVQRNTCIKFRHSNGITMALNIIT